MKTIVRRGLMGSFRPVLGQDDGGFYTWENQGDWGGGGVPGVIGYDTLNDGTTSEGGSDFSWNQIDDGTYSGGVPGAITSWDQINNGDYSGGVPGAITSWDQINDGTYSGGVPGAITSWDQIVPPAERPPGMSDKDWAEIVTAGLKAGAAGYGAYAGVEAERLKREAALAKAKPGILPDLTLPSGAVNPNAMFLIGGVVLVGVLAVIGLK